MLNSLILLPLIAVQTKSVIESSKFDKSFWDEYRRVYPDVNHSRIYKMNDLIQQKPDEAFGSALIYIYDRVFEAQEDSVGIQKLSTEFYYVFSQIVRKDKKYLSVLETSKSSVILQIVGYIRKYDGI